MDYFFDAATVMDSTMEIYEWKLCTHRVKRYGLEEAVSLLGMFTGKVYIFMSVNEKRVFFCKGWENLICILPKIWLLYKR